MRIHEGLFVGVDGTTFIRHVHSAVSGYQLGSPESPRYERTTRLDPEGRVIFQQQPRLVQPTVLSDLNAPAAAEEYLQAAETAASAATTASAAVEGGESGQIGSAPLEPTTEAQGSTAVAPAATTGVLAGIRWIGVVPARKWTNFNARVLSRFANGSGMKVTVTVDVAPAGGVPKSKIDEMRVALRELGLSETIQVTESVV